MLCRGLSTTCGNGSPVWVLGCRCICRGVLGGGRQLAEVLEPACCCCDHLAARIVCLFSHGLGRVLDSTVDKVELPTRLDGSKAGHTLGVAVVQSARDTSDRDVMGQFINGNQGRKGAIFARQEV